METVERTRWFLFGCAKVVVPRLSPVVRVYATEEMHGSQIAHARLKRCRLETVAMCAGCTRIVPT